MSYSDSAEDGSATDVCAVCFDDLRAVGDGDSVHRLPCGHSFHCACVVRWFRAGSGSCPTCRDDPPIDLGAVLNPMDIMERYKYVRRRARSKRAPPELQRLVAHLQRSERSARERSRAWTAFRKEHRETITRLHRLRASVWTAQRQVRRGQRAVGLFAHSGMPLPALRVAPRIYPA